MTDTEIPDPEEYSIPTIDELDAMRVEQNLSQAELSRRAGLESGRFNTILHREMDPHVSTMRAFVEVLQEASAENDSDQSLDKEDIEEATRSKRGPKPKPSTLVDKLKRTDPEEVN